MKPVLTPMAQRIDDAWQVLSRVMDPEVPAISVVDLGIVRDVSSDDGTDPPGWTVTLTPTYSGCPATEAIESDVRQALSDAGFAPLTVRLRRAPAWTSDWITAQGRERLRAYGIAPPSTQACAADSNQSRAGHASVAPIHLAGRLGDVARRRLLPDAPAIACPHCDSADTERLSAFGSTACKAIYRCRACRDPFEYFKPI